MYERIMKILESYLTNDELDKFQSCYKNIEEEYKNKLYLDKINTLEYINKVVLSLAQYQVSIQSLITCLLIEKENIDYNCIKKEYGEDIATMYDSLIKIGNVKEKTNYEIDNENYRKIFVALAKDYRVLVIRLIMQQELLMYLDLFDTKFKKTIGKETIDVFSPIARRLGMDRVKNNLENKAIYYMENETYMFIERMLDKQKEERQENVDNMITNIKKLLKEHNIPYISIKGRPKEICSIYDKMINRHKDFEEIYDLLGIRIITETKVNCYEVLGYIHAIYRPIAGKFKDYIALPKSNMYQSLHTTIVDDDGNAYEIQIRTKEMDEFAENGIAAHWRYKERGKGMLTEIEDKLHFFKEFIDANTDTKDKEEYAENIKKEIFESSIYVMSPKGKVVDLPIGACPIDFAYRIHSKVGHSCVGALVNGIMVPLSSELKTGDVIEIKTSKIHTIPSESWLQFVKTSNAKNYIRKELQKIKTEMFKEDIIHKGKNILFEEARNKNVNEKDINEAFSDITFLQQFGVNKIDDLYLVIANRSVSPINVIDKVKNKKEIKKTPKFEFKKKNIKSTDNHGVIVKGINVIKLESAQCCCPIPGDEIVGYISRGKGIKIHRANCPTLKNVTERLIEVNWDSRVTDNVLYPVDLIIRASDRNNLLVEIMNTLSTLKISATELNAISHKQNLNASIHLSIMVKDREQYQVVEKSLKNIRGVYEVERTSRN